MGERAEVRAALCSELRRHQWKGQGLALEPLALRAVRGQVLRQRHRRASGRGGPSGPAEPLGTLSCSEGPLVAWGWFSS